MTDRETTFLDKVKELGLELNSDLEKAFIDSEFSKKSLFIFGQAGTGKSQYINAMTRLSQKSIAVVAPTGIAAINVKGQTIHSFFQLPLGLICRDTISINNTVTEKIRGIDLLIIDEISMVRIDVLMGIDLLCRLALDNQKVPFGGLQVVIIGDLYQLPPVVQSEERDLLKSMFHSKWFFKNPIIDHFEVIEFNKVYRQKDQIYKDILSMIRVGTIGLQSLAMLNSRVTDDVPKDTIMVVTTNRHADNINIQNLNRLSAPVKTFNGKVIGSYPESYQIAPSKLDLKVGAQVMVLRNIKEDNIYNGTMGIVESIDVDDKSVVIRDLSDGIKKTIREATWERYSYGLNSEGKVSKSAIGKYTQIPLKLAFAVTVHKTQSLSFDKAAINLSSGVFEFGQVYVALSRIRSLSGLYLSRRLRSTEVMVDPEVAEFVKSLKVVEGVK